MSEEQIWIDFDKKVVVLKSDLREMLQNVYDDWEDHYGDPEAYAWWTRLKEAAE